MAEFHKNLTGSDLHEPKGVETATEGTVYVADGNGSGEWVQPFSRSLEAHFDSGNIQSISIDSSNPTYWIIDGLDSRTNIDGVTTGSPLWNTTTNEIDLFNQNLSTGSVLYLNLGFRIDPSDSTDTDVRLYLEFNHESGAEVLYELGRFEVPKGISKGYNISSLVFLDNTIDVNLPVKIGMNANVANGTITNKNITIQTV